MWPFHVEVVEEKGLCAEFFSSPFYDPGYVVLLMACFGFVISVYDTIQLLKSPDRTTKAELQIVSPEVLHRTKLIFTFLSVEHNALLYSGAVTHNASFLLPWMIAAGGVILFGSFLVLARIWKEGVHVASRELLSTTVFLVKAGHVFWYYALITGWA